MGTVFKQSSLSTTLIKDISQLTARL